MRPLTRSFYQAVVQRTVERIAQGLDEALDLEALAAEAGLSPFHFHRIFRGMLGETPLTLSRRLRMERAAWQLAHGSASVTRIALDAGFDTHEGFTRAFRAAYATSPSGFRRRAYARHVLATSSGVHFDPAGAVPSFQPRDSGGSAMQVELKVMPDLHVGTVQHIGPYNQIPLAFERLGAVVAQSSLPRCADAVLIAIYHDDPEAVPPSELRSDAAITLPSAANVPDGLALQRIPAGLYACTTHVGPYELLGDTWARFMGEWLPASGHRLAAGPSYELYRDMPGSAPESGLRTELYLPLAS